MRCVPNLTEMVISQSPIIQLIFSKSSIIVRSLGNSHQLRSLTTLSVVTLSLPGLSIELARIITKGSSCFTSNRISKLGRIDERHTLVVTIHIELIILLELILGNTCRLICSRID